MCEKRLGCKDIKHFLKPQEGSKLSVSVDGSFSVTSKQKKDLLVVSKRTNSKYLDRQVFYGNGSNIEKLSDITEDEFISQVKGMLSDRDIEFYIKF